MSVIEKVNGHKVKLSSGEHNYRCIVCFANAQYLESYEEIECSKP